MVKIMKQIKKLNYEMKTQDVVKLLGEPTTTLSNEQGDDIYVYVVESKGIRGWLYKDFKKLSLLFTDNRLVNVRKAKSKTIILKARGDK